MSDDEQLVRLNLQGIIQPWFKKYQWSLAFEAFAIHEELSWKIPKKESRQRWQGMAHGDREDWLATVGFTVARLLQIVNGEFEPKEIAPDAAMSRAADRGQDGGER